MSEPTASPKLRDVASTDGVTLRTFDFGDSGQPVLAAHATGFNALVWSPLVQALNDAHVVAPDFRAHGGSTIEPGAELDWDGFGDDVLATLDAYGWLNRFADEPKPVGIGHSMGGAALLLAEQRRPGTFAALWVYEPIIFPPEVRIGMADAENPLAIGARRRRSTFASREEAMATYASKPPMNSFDPAALAGYVAGAFVDESDGSVRLACRGEDESRVYGTASTCTAFEHLGEVTCPVIVVRGEMADFSPAAIAVPAAEALPHGELVAHNELSHFGPMENPTGLAAEITALIASL